MSTLDPDNEPSQPRTAPGHDNDTLGPGDSSDTGSDIAGTRRPLGGTVPEDPLGEIAGEDTETDSDREGTGERATVEGPDEGAEPDDMEETEELNLDEDATPDLNEGSPDWKDDPSTL